MPRNRDTHGVPQEVRIILGAIRLKTLNTDDFTRLVAQPQQKIYDTLGITKDEYHTIIEAKKQDKEGWMDLEIIDILKRVGIDPDIWMKYTTAAVLKYKVKGEDSDYTVMLSGILIDSGVGGITLEDFIGIIQLMNFTCLKAVKISKELLKSGFFRSMLLGGTEGGERR